MNVLFIDNFDSFTYNLVEEFEKRGCNVLVYRNNVDVKTMDKIVARFSPSLIVISPGPGTPRSAGHSIDYIRRYHETIPLLGICLGHQAIIEAFDGVVGKANEIFHGKPSRITHDGEGIFKDIENPFQAGRYHSLTAVDVPYCFEIAARSENDLIMSVRHKDFDVIGLQFHPESILTPAGGLLIDNAINMSKNDTTNNKKARGKSRP